MYDYLYAHVKEHDLYQNTSLYFSLHFTLTTLLDVTNEWYLNPCTYEGGGGGERRGAVVATPSEIFVIFS